MWLYSQSTGVLTDPTGARLVEGYAGHGAGLNNPALQYVHNEGPLPQGDYLIGDLVPEHVTTDGVHLLNALPLIPNPKNVMFGRAGFWLHGDNDEMNHTASDGCPVLPEWVRMQVNESDDRQLRVTA